MRGSGSEVSNLRRMKGICVDVSEGRGGDAIGKQSRIFVDGRINVIVITNVVIINRVECMMTMEEMVCGTRGRFVRK